MYSKRIVISIIVIGCLAHVSFFPFYNYLYEFRYRFSFGKTIYNYLYSMYHIYVLYYIYILYERWGDFI